MYKTHSSISSQYTMYSNQDFDNKDHLAVGEEALLNAMAKYKNADKIVQINEVTDNSHLTSHLVHYMNEINKAGHIPKGFGLVHRKNGINEIDCTDCKISDQQAKAIAASLNRAKYVSTLRLRNTGLSDEQGISILRSMDRKLIRHLDVSYNPQLTKKFYDELWQILADPVCIIDRLEIEGNKIGDRMTADMVQAFGANKSLVYLNAARNNIGDKGARHIALMIQECPKLRLLFLHDNRMLGYGSAEIAEAVGNSSSLQVFDISWNSVCSTGRTKKREDSVEDERNEKDQGKGKKKPKAAKQGPNAAKKPGGKGFSGLFARGFAEAWSEAFAQNKSLLHVDMSHNSLEQTDVEIIGEGLRKNQQILGIHFQGHDGDIDTQGFVKAGKPMSVAQGGAVMTRLPQHDEIQVGIVRGQRALALSPHSNCWLCEGWSEHRFTYEPGVSDNKPNHDEFKPIKLHLDIDHFQGDLMMKHGQENPEYEVYRMLPPGDHRYFFSVDGQPSVAQNHAKTAAIKQKKEKKLYLDMSKIEVPSFNKNSAKNSLKSTPKGSKKSSNKPFFRAKKPAAEEKPPVDYYELNLPEVNYIENIHQTRTIYSREQLEAEKSLSKTQFRPAIGQVERMIANMNCEPRPGPKDLGNRSKVRTPWDFTLSVFASYKADTDKLLTDCFETDWARTKVDKIVKNESERAELKVYCRSIYKWFREVYKFVAGSDPMGDVFCIGINVFGELCTQGLEDFVDGRFLKVADLDLERIKTNANEKNSKFNPKNNIVRHNFLEVFMRLCDQKYLKSQAGGPDVNTMTEAFQMMFEKECYPYFSQFDSQKWRARYLWQEDVDFTLKISLDPLRAIYKKYIGKNALPGACQYMSFSEFNECILAANCLSDNFGGKQVGNMYNLAMMTQVDEIEKDRHINMIFVEFLEAVVRVADKTEIPHCVHDEFTWGVDEIDPEMRETYSKRDIVTKLEAFIMFLINGNLTSAAYNKYISSLEEYKSMKIYANDIDTGNLNLNTRRS